MKRIIIALAMMITSMAFSQEVIHTVDLVNLETDKEFSIDIIDLGDEYFFRGSDSEEVDNKVINNFEYIFILKELLENEFISIDDYMLLVERHEKKLKDKKDK